LGQDVAHELSGDGNLSAIDMALSLDGKWMKYKQF
jgi:cyanate lyase